MDKTNNIEEANKWAELENRLNQLENKTQKYKNEIYELNLHRIEQIIPIYSYHYGNRFECDDYINNNKAIEICKYFFNQGIRFGKGEDMKIGLDSKYKFIYE